jgi:hypothetical protein
LAVVLASKFTHGAWLVVVAMPLLVYAIHTLGKHQQRLEHTASVEPRRAQPLVEAVASHTHHHVLIPVAAPDRVALHAVAYVNSLLGRERSDSNGHAGDTVAI